MSRKQDFLDVVQRKIPERVPLWELHFHLWSVLSNGQFVSGKAFAALTAHQKREAIAKNAEVMADWGERLGFAAVSIPDTPWDCVYTLEPHWRIELIRQLKQLNPSFYVVGGCCGLIGMPTSSHGYEEFCYHLFDEPEAVDTECAAGYESFKVEADRLADAGIDGLYFAADIADNRAPFFNSEQIQRWYFPYLRKHAEYAKAKGLFALLHTDGNIETLLGDIRTSGVQILQAIDPVAGMDIAKTKRALQGEVAVCGNFDCGLMITGTPQQVYDSAKHIVLSCKDGGGFVFGNTNAVDITTPVENYMAMLEAWNAFG